MVTSSSIPTATSSLLATAMSIGSYHSLKYSIKRNKQILKKIQRSKRRAGFKEAYPNHPGRPGAVGGSSKGHAAGTVFQLKQATAQGATHGVIVRKLTTPHMYVAVALHKGTDEMFNKLGGLFSIHHHDVKPLGKFSTSGRIIK